MLTLNNAVQKTMGNVNRYIESWKKHSSLWKVDKNGVLDKFAAKSPTNAQFEEKLSKYYKMSEEMWSQVFFLHLVADPDKNHCLYAAQAPNCI